ncbi:MAG TPA: IPTL-CTERM sorting domain-containing protein [Casimicrobiaceae bacterium]|nr:IPTL-CTERM sorting domain-containing protein [Casimicrobiaceae bacterium]
MDARRPRSRPPVISRRRRWVQLIAQAIPTLNEWGIIVLALGVAIAGVRAVRLAARSRNARR